MGLHVSDGQQEEGEALQLAREQSLQMLQAVQGILDNILGGGPRCYWSTLRVNGLEHFDGQGRWCCAVELGDFVQNFNGLGLPAFADQKLGRFVELEHEVSEEEDEQSHASQDDHGVAPADVARNCATLRSILDRVASRQRCAATPFGGGPVGDRRGHNHTDRLPHGKQEHQEASILREKFQRNCRVDGDVASKADRCEEVNATNSAVVVLWRGQQETEDGSDQTSEVECPTSSDNVDNDTPAKSAYSQTGIGAGPDVAVRTGRDVHFLVDGRSDQTDSLGPGQIQEVTKAT